MEHDSNAKNDVGEARKRVLESFEATRARTDAEARKIMSGSESWEEAAAPARQAVMNCAALETDLGGEEEALGIEVQLVSWRDRAAYFGLGLAGGFILGSFLRRTGGLRRLRPFRGFPLKTRPFAR